MVEHLIVGKVLCPWGVKGQVKVEPLTDDIQRFKNLKSVLVSGDNRRLTENIESVNLLQNKYVAVKLQGIDTRDLAEKLRGCLLEVPRDEAIKLPKGRFFISDIIGIRVLDEKGDILGTVSDVLQTKANDVYVFKDNVGKEYLIPAIKEVIIDIDLENNKMIIRPLEGMLE